MEPIHVRQRLRPLRLAFMVKPEDRDAALKAVALNTALWGGVYNPIVPITPSEECIGVVREFDPDMLVDLSGGILPTVIAGRYQGRVITEEQLVGRDERSGRQYLRLAFDVLPLWRDIHEHELRFSSERSRVVAIGVESGSEWEPYVAFLFGTFARLPVTATDFKEMYLQALRGEELAFDPTKGPIELEKRISPIRLTGYGLRLFGRSAGFSSHIIYVGDRNNLSDLIEFWNLRATGRRVWFVPVEFPGPHESMIRAIAAEGRYPINAQIENQTDLQKGPSISETAFHGVADWIAQLGLALPRRSWRPRYGLEIELYVGDIHVSETEAQTGEELSFLQAGRMTPIKLIRPKYLDPDEGQRSEYSWGVEIGMSGGYFDNEWMFAFPVEPTVEKLVQRAVAGMAEDVRLFRNGIVLKENTLGGSAYLLPVRTRDVFYALFEQAGFDTEASLPGRYAEQIIEKMGRRLQFDCRVFKLRGVREVLGRLSKGDTLTKGNMRDIVMSTAPDDYGQNWRPDLYDHLVIRSGQGSRSPDFGDIFDVLLEKRVIRPGLILQCPRCFAKDWYHVSEFDEEYTCRYCFTKQRVPFGSKGEWHYKADGLFRLPDSALGSLGVILAMWRLQQITGALSSGRYLPSVNVRSRDSGWDAEVDYAYLQVGRWAGNYELALGQSTGFLEFTKEEVEKAVRVADAFEKRPHLVFATLRDAFGEGEKALLRKLVDNNYSIIALTRLELDPYDLHERFKDAPTKYAVTLEGLSRNTIALNLH